MLLAEYNYEDDINEQREESRAEGYAEGRTEGRAEGYAEGRAESYAEGRAEGYAEGFAEGEGKLADLITRLFTTGRSSEVEKAASDKAYREKLFREFDLL